MSVEVEQHFENILNRSPQKEKPDFKRILDEAKKTFYAFALPWSWVPPDMSIHSNVLLIHAIEKLVQEQTLEFHQVEGRIKKIKEDLSCDVKAQCGDLKWTMEISLLTSFAEYFGVEAETLLWVEALLKKDGLNMSLIVALQRIKGYIEWNFKEYHPLFRELIKKQIVQSVMGNITEAIKRISPTSDKPLKWYRWELNEAIHESLDDFTHKILPSLVFYKKFTQVPVQDRGKFLDEALSWINAWDNSMKRLLMQDEWVVLMTLICMFDQKCVTDWINLKSDAMWKHQIMRKIEATKRMLESWKFQISYFQSFLAWGNPIFSTEHKEENQILERKWVTPFPELSFLSKEDEKNDRTVKSLYLALSLFQVVPYAWATVSLPSDTISLLSTHDGTLKLLKETLWWVIPPDYEMSKHWYDYVFAWVWIVGTAIWAQAASKVPRVQRLIKIATSIHPDEIKQALKTVGEALKSKLWIPDVGKWIEHCLAILGIKKPKETNIHVNMPLEQIGKLDDPERLQLAELLLKDSKFLERELDVTEKRAIIQAHLVWSGRDGAGFGVYWQLVVGTRYEDLG